MRKVFISLFLLFLLASVHFTALAQAQADIALRVRGSAVPGGVLFVSAEGEGLTGGMWYWAAREGKLAPAPYGLRAALAVPLDANPGDSATLRLRVRNAEGVTELSRKVKIDYKKRPVQYLNMSASNDAKYSDPQAVRENKSVKAAFAEFVPDILWHGNFREPLNAPRSSPFGVRRIRNGRTAGFHRGLDYAEWEGVPVLAPAAGVVSLTGPGFVLLGNCVVLNHGVGISSIYMHLSQISVAKGEKVRAGQELGLVGTTGASTGPHLHYAVYCNGKPVDPDIMLSIPKDWAPDAF